MDHHTIEEIEQVDGTISFQRTSLFKSSEMATKAKNETFDLPQLQNEIKEQRALLRVSLKDKPRPWYYHRHLPRELLVQIFKWITHPGDQVNLRRAFPGIGDLMKWDSVDLLYFKRIYPLVQDYLWPDWRHIWKLCQVSPDFMDVVLHHFQNDLSDIQIIQRRHSRFKYYCISLLPKQVIPKVTTFIDECEELGETEWMTNMPFLVGFDIHCYLDEPSSLEFFTRFLDEHGQQIWALQLTMWIDGGDGSLDEFLIGILKRTPNVVYLQLNFDNDNYSAFLRAPDNLPYLRKLRNLSFLDVASESFIQKYAAQLTSWRIRGFSPVFHNVSFPNLRFYCSRNYWTTIHDVVAVLPDSVLESPLQSFSMFLLEDDEEGIPKLPAALYLLSDIGDTLQDLTLDFIVDPPWNWNVTGKHWKPRVRLPKVRRLELQSYRGTLDWLVVLPSVHTLVLEDYNRRAKADVGKSSPDLIYVSTRRITRFRTNIWTQLPNLRLLIIENESRWRESFGVTREEHEAYQNGSRFQKAAITILDVFQEIREPRLSARTLRFALAISIFIEFILILMLVLAYFCNLIEENVPYFTLGFIS